MNLDTAGRFFYLYTGLVVLSVLGSAASARFSIDPGFVAPLLGALMIASGAGVVAINLRSGRAAVGVLVLGTLVEVVGLLTGVPFGRYSYTDRWWPTLPLGADHRFPLLLPFAWLLIVGGSFGAVRKWVRGPWSIPTAALIATLVDWPMERAMTATLEYWRWSEPAEPFGAPLSNSVGWFVTSLLACGGLYAWADRTDTRRMAGTLGLFCLFVTAIGALHGFHPAWVVLAVLSFAFLVGERVSPARNPGDPA